MATAPSRPPLADVFLRLADDPDLLGEYDRDPRAVLERAGLSVEQIDAVLDGSPEEVRLLVERELETDPARRRLITTPRMVVHQAPERAPDEEPDEEPEPEKEPEEEPEPEPEPWRQEPA